MKWSDMLRSVLRIASDTVSKIPKRDDLFLEKVTKVLAIADAVRVEAGIGETSPIRSMCDRYDLVEHTSTPFVRLFFHTSLKDDFRVERVKLDGHMDLIFARAPDGGRILFQEFRWSRVETSSTFYASKGFDFARAAGPLWSRHKTGMLLSVGEQRQLTFSPLHRPEGDPLTRRSAEMVAKLIAEHRELLVDKVRRTYLFYGPPGTGKSTAAMHVALGAHEPRILRIDAEAMPFVDTADLVFLFNVLRPSFVIVDDVDRAPIDQASARALALVEALRKNEATVVLTANQPQRLGRAMLRPDRIDVPVPFPAPESDERTELVGRCFDALGGMPPTTQVIAAIVQETEGLTHAYVVDVCRRLRREPLEAVLASIRLLGELAKKAGEANDEEDGPGIAPDEKAPS